MKPFLPLSDKTRREIEVSYPFFTIVKENVLKALLGMEDKDEGTRIIFQALRRTESSVSAELSKLRTRPNRATKFSIYMKRMITMLKLSLDSLSDEEQVQAYPTLALISTHFVNIILPSSLRTTSLPKFVACHLYTFLKMVFSNDLEFVLDVLVCSNVFEDAESADNHTIGFYLLVEAMQDGYLYSHDTPAFAKYLTILSFIYEITSGGDEVLQRTIGDLDSQSVFHPRDVKAHLDSQFGMKLSKKKDANSGGPSWKEIIKRIKPRKIASITRQQRLVVVSIVKRIKNKKNSFTFQYNNEKDSRNDVYSPNSSSGLMKPLFFMDLGGENVDNDNENHVSSSDVVNMKYESDSSTDNHHDYPLRKESRSSFSSSSKSDIVLRPAVLDPYKLLPPYVNDDGGDHHEDESEEEQDYLELNRNKSSSFHKKRIFSEEEEEEEEEELMDIDNLPKLSPRKSFVDSSDDERLNNKKSNNNKINKKQEVKKHYESDTSEDEEELQVVFEEKATPKKKNSSGGISKNEYSPVYKKLPSSGDDSSSMDDESDQESRDFAPAESGEDDIPEYSPGDYFFPGEKMIGNGDDDDGSPGHDTTGTTITDGNDEDEEEKAKDDEEEEHQDEIKLEVVSPEEESQQSEEATGVCQQMMNQAEEIQSSSSTISMKSPPKSPPKSKRRRSEKEGTGRKSSEHDDTEDNNTTPTKRKRNSSLKNDSSPEKTIIMSPEKSTATKSPSSPTRSSPSKKKNIPELVLTKLPSPPVVTSPRRLRTRSDSGSSIQTPIKDDSKAKKNKEATAVLSPLKEEEPAEVTEKQGGRRGRKSTTTTMPSTVVTKGPAKRGRKSQASKEESPDTTEISPQKTKTTPPPVKTRINTRRGGQKVSESVTESSPGKISKGSRTPKKTTPSKKKDITPTNLRTTRSTRARAAKKT